MKEIMTVHEALCEIKVADKKIYDAIKNLNAVAYKKHSSTNVNGIAPSEFEEQAKAGYQKAIDLIRRTEAIKRAISKSNAVTTVIINGKEMSVAEAIYEMQHGVTNKTLLRDDLAKQYRQVINKIKDENENEIPRRADSYVQSTFGGKEKGIDPKAVEEARRMFEENNSLDLIDPIGVVKKIDALTDEIDKFSTAVDAALQVSNAKTQIEIDY